MSYKLRDIYSLQHVNICPLQSLFTPAQPRVIISEKVGAEIRLFPVSMGHQVWPKNPFLADGRIVLSAQGLGQQARTLVLLLLYWGAKDYLLQEIFSSRMGAWMKIFYKVSILVVELLSSQGNNLVDLGNNETSESIPSRISQVEEKTGIVLDVSGMIKMCTNYDINFMHILSTMI